MSKMYILNCTRQVQEFWYRLPESSKLLHQLIPIGGQIQVAGELNTPEIDAIIEQHSRYGMVAFSEINKSQPFVGYCYQIDKRFGNIVEALQRGLEHNDMVLEERGQQLREEAAVAINQSIEDQRAPARLTALEMTVEEEGDEGTFHKGVKVTKDRSVTPQSAQSTRKRKPRR
jgi:hypothetical protein